MSFNELEMFVNLKTDNEIEEWLNNETAKIVFIENFGGVLCNE